MSVLISQSIKSSQQRLCIYYSRLNSASHLATEVKGSQSQSKKRRKKDPPEALKILKNNDTNVKLQELKSLQESMSSANNERRSGEIINPKSEKKGKVNKMKMDNIFKIEDRKQRTAVLKSFILACEHSGCDIEVMLDFCSKTSPKMVDIEVYELLFKTLARGGHLESLQKVWKELVKNDIVPSPRCYASAFQCCGNLENTNNKIVKTMAKELLANLKRDHGKIFNLNELLAFSPRTELDYNQLLYVLQLADSKFKPAPIADSHPEFVYSQNDLVKKLSDDNINLDRLQPLIDTVSIEEMNSNFRQQLELEKVGYIEIESIQKETNKFGEQANTCFEMLKEKWKNSLTLEIQRRIDINRSRSDSFVAQNQVPLYPFLEMLPVESIVESILHELESILMLSDSYSPPAKIFQQNLSSHLMEKAHIRSITEEPCMTRKYHQIINEYNQWFLNPSQSDLKAWCPREAFAKIEAKYFEGSMLSKEINKWPRSIRTIIGKEMMQAAIDNVTFDMTSTGTILVEDEYEVYLTGHQKHLKIRPLHDDDKIVRHNSMPGFYKLLRYSGERLNEEIKPHPILSKLFENKMGQSITFEASHVPMICPPLPWQSSKRGGFYLRQSQFARMPPGEFESTNPDETAEKSDQAYPVFDSLNQLGSTPWVVNKPLLDIVIELFTCQEDNIDLLDDLSIAHHPDFIEKPEKTFEIEMIKFKMLTDPTNISPGEKSNYLKNRRDMAEYQKVKSETYSLWCDILYKLSIANHFRDEIMYFPHNIDFRGRVYPIAPHFHHMGGDLSRSLLKFAKGRPLGPKGLDWLKIHCINLTELKKKSPVTERLAYANEVMEDILDSANNPIKGKRWWIGAEDPWQTLSVCMEIRDALNHPEGPENFISHIPVHQDGSCNGLQHYAALGRDEYGGTYVNVVPGEAPQDVYSEIATLVEEKRAADHAKDPEHIAAKLDGFVRRKVIKQTVMTTVYGVTMYGAKLQIAKQLKDIDEYPQEHVNSGAAYLAQKTFESLNEMFTSSQEIQNWFTECATLISDDFLKNVEWNTPLGLYVQQPYFRNINQASVQVERQRLKKMTYNIPINYQGLKKIFLKPNTMKQRNGFPPNFVHSLDSTHMMLTSLYLWTRGCTFSSVHDCYWTHASDVEIMNQVCREQFVNLHQQPILNDLSKHFQNVYLDENLPISDITMSKAKQLFTDVPAKGKLDLEVVKKSVYFFS